MKSNLESNYLVTNDLPLASSLVCLGFSITDIDKADPKKVRFCFQKTEQLDKAVRAFWDNKLCVEPKAFSNCQKSLKARIYSSD